MAAHSNFHLQNEHSSHLLDYTAVLRFYFLYLKVASNSKQFTRQKNSSANVCGPYHGFRTHRNGHLFRTEQFCAREEFHKHDVSFSVPDELLFSSQFFLQLIEARCSHWLRSYWLSFYLHSFVLHTSWTRSATVRSTCSKSSPSTVGTLRQHVRHLLRQLSYCSSTLPYLPLQSCKPTNRCGK